MVSERLSAKISPLSAKEPPSPSPRVGRDVWAQSEAAQESSQPLSFNVKGTLERRRRMQAAMANSRCSFKTKYTLSGGTAATGGGTSCGGTTGDNSVTQVR